MKKKNHFLLPGVSLPRAIACWEQRLGAGGKRPRHQVGCAPRRLVERCSWPQCNGSCPRLRDPRTGEEVALAALLQSFGLDVNSAAAAMGIDARALSRMSRAELLPLLAPHTWFLTIQILATLLCCYAKRLFVPRARWIYLVNCCTNTYNLMFRYYLLFMDANVSYLWRK